MANNKEDTAFKWLNYFKIVIFMLSFFVFSCAKENQDLVNPPAIFETVNVRFLNMAGDEEPRTLVLNKTLTFPDVQFNNITPEEMPPFDSVYVDIYKSGVLEYSKGTQHKFARSTKYVFISLPSPIGSAEYRDVDTIIALQTTNVLPNDTNECYLKMLNANPDTTVTYSLRLGCPSDSAIFSNMTYRQSSGVYSMYKGKYVFSILKNLITVSDTNTVTSSEIVGIYELDLINLRQYAIIINKHDEVWFLDELSDATNPLIQPVELQSTESYVRVVNLSESDVTIRKEPGSIIAAGVPSNFIDKYITLSACDNTSKDKLLLEYNGEVMDSVYTSFDVNYHSSVLVFDNQYERAKMQVPSVLVVVPPIKNLRTSRVGKAVVRVVNANYMDAGIDVSTGARSISNNRDTSDQKLAVSLQNHEVSGSTVLDAGIVPVVVFSSTKPAKYLFSSNVNIEANKNYIIAVDFSDINGGRITLIEDTQELEPTESADQSAYLQIVNVVTGINGISISCGNILNNAKLGYSNILATFVPEGDNTVIINGISYTFNATKSKRIVLIASNTSNAIDIFDIQDVAMGATDRDYKRRFINAAADVSALTVRLDSTNVIVTNLPYKSASKPATQKKESKFSLSFFNKYSEIYDENDQIAVFGDLLMTFYKNYTVIFYGNYGTKESHNYNMLSLQEY